MVEDENGERNFLHDISSPLTIALGMAEAVMDAFKEQPAVDVKVLQRLEKCITALNRMATQIETRRSTVKSRSAS